MLNQCANKLNEKFEFGLANVAVCDLDFEIDFAILHFILKNAILSNENLAFFRNTWSHIIAVKRIRESHSFSKLFLACIKTLFIKMAKNIPTDIKNEDNLYFYQPFSDFHNFFSIPEINFQIRVLSMSAFSIFEILIDELGKIQLMIKGFMITQQAFKRLLKYIIGSVN